MYTLTIKVTKEVIKRSMYCTNDYGYVDEGEGIGNNCAIARAVRDIFPHIWVNRHTIGFHKGNPIVTSPYAIVGLPDNAAFFIDNFDSLADAPEQRLDLEPIEFEIEVPDAVINRIDIEEVKKILTNHETMVLHHS